MVEGGGSVTLAGTAHQGFAVAGDGLNSPAASIAAISANVKPASRRVRTQAACWGAWRGQRAV